MRRTTRRTLVALTTAMLLGSLAALQAADTAKTKAGAKTKAPGKTEAKAPAQAPPTLANVPYGTHERQVLDFYKADSSQPTPLLFYIHGGGWVNGDKGRVANLDKYLAAGISVVSINYRYNTQAQEAGVKPPVQWPLHDAARALQFVRSKASQWNIDKQRIGASGGSAGACSSLWLAFHPDMADPNSADPVARESTRLWCAAVVGAQTTLDPKQMKEWTPNSRYGGHAFGFMPDPSDTKTRDTQFAQFLAGRDNVLPWIKEYSPFEHVSADDPPIYMFYSAPPAMGQEQKDPTHTANFGVKLEEKLRSVGVPCELVYPDAPDVKHPQAYDYLIEKLKAPKNQ
jgi:acetyl esterase/lipase